MSERSQALEQQAVRDASPAYSVEGETAGAEVVPPGYKRTEVGVIPENWSIVQLKNLVEFLDSQRRPVKGSDRAKMAGIYPYYGASGIVDYVNDYLFNEDLILLGEDGENILSRNLPLAFKVTGKIWVNNHAHVLRPSSRTDIGYLTGYLEAQDYSERNSGTAQPKLNRATCAKIPVALPSIQEQRAIATALSDADALIESLDRLIAKKRDIKQATMQQLLTGEKRLPGFEGEWETKRLGEVLCFQVGFPFRSVFFNTEGQGIRVVRNGDLKGDEVSLYYEGHFDSSFEVHNGDVLIGMDGDFVPHLWNRGRALLNQRVGRIVGSLELDVKFAFYRLAGPLREIERSTSATTVKHLSHGDIANIELPLPEIHEQTAIATVLSDMDTEIEALERRRDKTKQIKQGMMQQLLTGRVRLVDPSTQETKESA